MEMKRHQDEPPATSPLGGEVLQYNKRWRSGKSEMPNIYEIVAILIFLLSLSSLNREKFLPGRLHLDAVGDFTEDPLPGQEEPRVGQRECPP